MNIEKLWTVDLGTQEEIYVLQWIIVGFQQSDRQDSQNLIKDAFYRLPATSAQFICGTENYHDSAILIIYEDDDYSRGHGQIKEAFTALTKIDICKPYISDNDFRSFNERNIIGYNQCVFDIGYQKNLESAQPIEVEIKFSENFPTEIYVCALVLTNNLVSIGSDDQQHFDLI